ncbi:MAG: SprT family zinc-dependent metalloprotease [Pseudomonadota bacterium]
MPNTNIPIFLTRNTRAKRITLRVHSAHRKVLLTLPKTTSIKQAQRFAERHTTWIIEKFEKLPPFVPFEHNAIIPFHGILHKIVFCNHKIRHQQIVTIYKNQNLPGEHYPILKVHGPYEHAPRRLLDWLKKQARTELQERVTYHACNLNLHPKRVAIRDQKSRWGSCSSTGALSFSWRLILAPYFVLDYVAAHEVAHLAEMNHGKRFWQLVRQTMPDMDKAEEWLKENGTSLHGYG